MVSLHLAPGLVAGQATPEVTVRFRLPASPLVDAVRVERIVGACPTAGIRIDGEVQVEVPASTP